MPPTYDLIFSIFAFVFGASIGSFLNVCIYRMPRDLSVNEPKRSFCPSCKYQIPFHNNIPLFSWLLLGGKCANCKSRIAFRYFGVELLTALLFLAIWRLVAHSEPILFFPYVVLVSLFVVATFIDFEFFIIPDEITWGGTAAGILLSIAIPQMMGTDNHLIAGMWSVIGAATGYFTLWAVVELGKKAFGKKTLSFEKPEAFTWIRHGEDADFEVDAEKQLWSEFFARDSDRLLIQATSVKLDAEAFENTLLEFHFDRVRIGEKVWALDKLDTINGTLTSITIPREAMGFGDVKFIAAIGAFLGWKAVFFTVFGASFVGAIVGITAIGLGRREWSGKIPFGPYLALAALAWMFTGPRLVHWYMGLIAS